MEGVTRERLIEAGDRGIKGQGRRVNQEKEL